MIASSLRPLLTVRQASELLNIAESTLRGWLCDGRFTFVKFGRRTMLRRQDLEAYVAAGVVPAELPPPASLQRRRGRRTGAGAP